MEGKRFEIDEGYRVDGTNGKIIYDNEGIDDYYFIYDNQELEDFVKLLNELNDENRELQKKVKDWKFVNDFQEKEIDGLKALLKEYEGLEEAYDMVKKENDQLKEKNKLIGPLKRDLYRVIADTKDTPYGNSITMTKIRERWE